MCVCLFMCKTCSGNIKINDGGTDAPENTSIFYYNIYVCLGGSWWVSYERRKLVNSTIQRKIGMHRRESLCSQCLLTHTHVHACPCPHT